MGGIFFFCGFLGGGIVVFVEVVFDVVYIEVIKSLSVVVSSSFM